jgi:hypothetical protein
MGWNDSHTSVGAQWGSAPTVCEGINARVTLAVTNMITKAYALDGAGARNHEVPVSLWEGKPVIEVGSRFKTIWYEIVFE